MEDGAFLARCLGVVIEGRATIPDAVRLYERGRMPKASYKQQVSFLNGWIWHLPDGPAQEARDKAMECELRGEVPMRSPNLYGDPGCVQECYGYDAEKHADNEIETWLNEGRAVRGALTTVQQERADQIANWFLPEGHEFQIRPRL
jgi:salicylate hydroxylase